MTLDQLEILIKIKKMNFDAITENLSNINILIAEGWLFKNNSALTLTHRAEINLQSILAIMTTISLDSKELENYENQITYEIKSRASELIKTKQLSIKLYAKAQTMKELATRYSNAGWDAEVKDASLILKVKKDFSIN